MISKRLFRPDLTDYETYADMIKDVLNVEATNKMSKTDVVKIALERMLQDFCHQVEIRKARKLYQTLKL